ncbi:MAG: portal protein [Pelagibacterales bacterium]|nr:portal protein [Pelagibacterales bacterium]
MANTSLRSRLKRLFATNVVVRRISKNRLRAVDTNKLQSTGNLSNKRYVDRFSGVHRGMPGYGSYNQNQSFHTAKIELFTDYEAMDMDPIISSALDIYADESTIKDADGDTLTISSPNDEVRKILRNLFYDILNIDYNLWPWMRNACKYGDFYLHLDIEEEIGIVNVTPMSAYEIRRDEGFDEKNPYAYKFVLEQTHGGGSTFTSPSAGLNTEFQPFEIAHFRLLSDTNFLPYGKSMIEGARKVFKQLMLMEDAMLIHRIMRAPERRIFKIDIGNIPPNEVDNHIQQIINKMKKVPYIDEKTGDYNLKFNMQNMIEDYFMPVRGGDSGTSIEALPGLSNDGQIEDIDYLKNKMFAALKIPKAFLGYDEGVEGKATLAAEDVRFARTIERLQKIFVSELTKIAIVHLYTQGYTDGDLVNFELSLTNPSIVYEKQKVEILNEKIGLANTMKESNMFSQQWIYENLFGLSHNEWKLEQEQIIEDLKQQFRQEQIKSEGNDPKKTNQSFGTPHDIASMHVANKGGLLPGMEQEHAPGTGRPKESGTWGTHDSPHGRDPLAIKALGNTFATDKSPLQHKYRGGSPLSTENIEIESLIKSMESTKKSPKIIQETMSTEVIDGDKGTMLDESQLIEE